MYGNRASEQNKSGAQRDSSPSKKPLEKSRSPQKRASDFAAAAISQKEALSADRQAKRVTQSCQRQSRGKLGVDRAGVLVQAEMLRKNSCAKKI